MFPGEPVYAQVNRDKKKNSRNQHMEGHAVMNSGYHPHDVQGHLPQHGNYVEHAELWQQQQQQQTSSPRSGQQQLPENAAGGDSWV